ncbi:MAG: ParB/RepB/Spo0J family partition protein, partial [Oscillospiraceae bacterium]|nr:ParB/RepB/Spo0J family partition protein [Oscillospiraceae bacterium]
TKRVKNDPKQVQIQEIIAPNDPTPLEKEEMERKKQANILKRRASNFTYGVDIYKNFQYVDIDLITPCPPNWNYFKKPNKEQLITLISSVESVGVLCPLILYKQKNHDDYTVICGHSRLAALKNLFENTQDIRYKKAPCYVLDYDEIDEYYIRAMIIDSNLSYRSMDKTVLMKAIIERYTILKRTKTYRSEINLAQALADEFLVSRSTVYNYLCLKKLCEEAMVLLLEKRINLQAARYLARVNHEVQVMILENFGIENINTIHRIKLLTMKDNIELPELLKLIEKAKELVPFKTTIKVTVVRHLVNKFFELAADLNKYAITNYQGVFHTNNSKRYCNIAYNEEEIKYYLEKDMINLENLNIVNARNIEELHRR